jgi:hypothetical protein
VRYSVLMGIRWLRDRQTFEQWTKMRRRGHFTYIAVGVLLMLGCYVGVRLVHVGAFKLGWLSSPGSTTLANAFFDAALPGFIAAEITWSDMKRKFSLPPNEDRTMI